MNKKKFKVIQLNGASGLLLILLLVLGLLGSFLILPLYGIKFIWNEFVSVYFNVQTIRLAQASLLWFAIIALIYGYLSKRIQFKFVNSSEFPNNDLKSIDYDKFVEKIKKEQQNDEKINH